MENKLSDKTDIITELNKTILGYTTGGDSYPKLGLIQNTSSPDSDLAIGFYFSLRIEGEFVLKKFKVRIVDIKDFTTKSSAVYHTDLVNLDLNFPTPFISMNLNHPNLVYTKDYDEIKPNKNYVLPDKNYKSPNPDIVLNSSITLDKKLLQQGFNIYCQSEHKFWFYQIRFITIDDKTEYAITQSELIQKDWKILESETYKSDGYNLIDKLGNPIFYGK